MKKRKTAEDPENLPPPLRRKVTSKKKKLRFYHSGFHNYTESRMSNQTDHVEFDTLLMESNMEEVVPILHLAYIGDSTNQSVISKNQVLNEETTHRRKLRIRSRICRKK